MKYQYREPKRRKANLKVRRTGKMEDLPLWEKVKQAITVREMVEQYVDLNAKGMGLCPFHDDTVPSFSVNDKENYWKCFAGCGGGSVIHFWMKLNNMDFGEALYDLAERFGIR